MENPVDKIAKHISECRYEDLPQEVVTCAKRSILDTLGVAWAGAGLTGCKEVYTLALEQGGKPESTVWVHGNKLPAISAAFVNSLFASALDLDSFHEVGTLHGDIVMLPATLAMAERQGVSGREFLTALILANDLTYRLGRSTILRTGWFFTSVHGVIGAAIATARLLGLGATQIKDAMGLAYSNAAGTQQATIERSLSKRLGSAFAARSGVHAGLLASVGCDGPHDFLEGRYGLFRMYENGDVGDVIRDLGKDYELTQVTIKRYPGCACTHAATDAILRLSSKHNFLSDQIEVIEVSLSPYMNRLVGAVFDPDNNPQVNAQFSVQYALACAVLFRRFGLNELKDAVIRDSHVRDMAKRVRVKVDESNTGIMTPVTVSILLRKGQIFTETVTAVPGTPELPLEQQQIIDKFFDCATDGPRPLTEEDCQALIDKVMTLEKVNDMSDFLSEFTTDQYNQ